MRYQEVAIVPREPSVVGAHQVRSTLIAASIQSLRQRGLVDRYLELVDPAWAERLLVVPAGVWLSMDHAHAHYAGCERLGLDDDAILGMGNSVAELTQKTAFSLAARLARESGATPTTILGVCPRLWARLFQGGSVAAYQIGPKDARFEVYGIPLAEHHYFRVGFRGLMHALVAPLCRTAIVRELRATKDGLTLKMSWV